jgi:catechol 2,3-dioxygenase-like lactoylglutathione lyase family enzyme
MLFLRSNTILYCRQWRRTVDFYSRCLGLAVSFENDWLVEFQVSDSSFVSIADAARATIGSADGLGITLSFKVADVKRTHRELTQAGVSLSAMRRIWGVKAFYVFDPEGHRIEIWGD